MLRVLVGYRPPEEPVPGNAAQTNSQTTVEAIVLTCRIRMFPLVAVTSSACLEAAAEGKLCQMGFALAHEYRNL